MFEWWMKEDGWVNTPHRWEWAHIYVVGPPGGPVKIGASGDLEHAIERADWRYPGSILWWSYLFGQKDLAFAIESEAHRLLRQHRFRAKNWGGGKGAPMDWFDVPVWLAVHAAQLRPWERYTHKQLTEVLNPEDLDHD